MATEITICMEDDGTFTLKTGEKEELPEEEAMEGGDEQTFKSKEEVMAALDEVMNAASMAPPPIEQEGAPVEEEALDPQAAQADEEMMMNQSFRPGTTGR